MSSAVKRDESAVIVSSRTNSWFHVCPGGGGGGSLTIRLATQYAPASKKSVEKGLFLDITVSSGVVDVFPEKGVCVFPLYRHLGVLFRKLGSLYRFRPLSTFRTGRRGVKYERIIINKFPILYVYLMFNPLSCASSHWYSTHSEWFVPFRVHASQRPKRCDHRVPHINGQYFPVDHTYLIFMISNSSVPTGGQGGQTAPPDEWQAKKKKKRERRRRRKEGKEGRFFFFACQLVV